MSDGEEALTDDEAIAMLWPSEDLRKIAQEAMLRHLSTMVERRFGNVLGQKLVDAEARVTVLLKALNTIDDGGSSPVTMQHLAKMKNDNMLWESRAYTLKEMVERVRELAQHLDFIAGTVERGLDDNGRKMVSTELRNAGNSLRRIPNWY